MTVWKALKRVTHGPRSLGDISQKEKRRLLLAVKRLERKAHLTGHTIVLDSAGGELYSHG